MKLSAHIARSESIAIDIPEAMQKARAAQCVWRRTTHKQRIRLLRKLRGLIAGNAMQLAEASARERHRPASEALAAEVLPLLEACRFLERELSKVLATKHVGKANRPLWLAGVTSEIIREPYGVILIIGPGNYPLLLPGVQLLQAIAAGNTVMLKPGVGGTRTAKLLISLIHDAGFPANVCTLLPESVDAAKRAIECKPDKVVFTGSSAVGREILRQLADHGIPSAMELSGSDAVIICEDADIELAAAAVAFGCTINDGATCMAPRRLFVSSKIAEQFERALRRRLEARLETGMHFLDDAQPQINGRFTDALSAAIADAMSAGAHVLHGGLRAESGVRAYPLVLSNVPGNSGLLQIDHFAPLLSIVYVSSLTEAIALANSHELGLGVSIFTTDLEKGRAIGNKLQAGVVTINDIIIPTADARLPLSGRKGSGFGATQGAEGLLEMTVPKVVSISRAKSRKGFAPLRSGDGELLAAFAKLTHQQSLRARAVALKEVVRQIARYGRGK